jgi:hypothetical protein
MPVVLLQNLVGVIDSKAMAAANGVQEIDGFK